MSTAYRVMADQPDGTIKSRDFVDITKAKATAVRWARVPIFRNIRIHPSAPIQYQYDKEVPYAGV